MNYGRLKREAYGECHACRWAGHDLVLWPIEFISHDERVAVYGYLSGEGKGQLVDGEPRRRKATFFLCPEHARMAHASWIAEARLEVDTIEVWDRYIERIKG